jgi:hypothetical protein
MEKQGDESCIIEDHIRMHKPKELGVEVSNSL